MRDGHDSWELLELVEDYGKLGLEFLLGYDLTAGTVFAIAGTLVVTRSSGLNTDTSRVQKESEGGRL